MGVPRPLDERVMATGKPTRRRDWSAYNRALVERGSLTVWIDEELIAQWAGERRARQLGRPQLYSDAAIQFVLTLRSLYGLTLRQAEGFAQSLFQRARLDLAVPDYTTLSRRSGRVTIDLGVAASPGPRTLLLDSTGLKVFGEGEWKVRQYGYSYRRTWRKLHLAVDARTLEIVACTTTVNGVSDGSQAEPLLAAVPEPVAAVKADGAYDQAGVYAVVAARSAAAVIPPRRDAVIGQHGNRAEARRPRDENLRGVRRYGRRGWKRRVGYHERSLAETTMYRLKVTFGDQLQSRTLETQKTESRIRCRILNKFTRLGLLDRAP
jgi:hypothetical protein